MRILMHARPGSNRVLAGDAVQARETAAALRKLGVHADLIEGEELPDFSSYDLVHLFNLIPVEGTYTFFRAASSAGKPMVLSPVYWDPGEFLASWNAGGGLGSWWERTQGLRRDILSGVRAIMPNSRAELECLQKDFRLPPHYIVPNGIDPAAFLPGRTSRGHGEGHVLCVARICPRKNQLGLLESLKETHIPLVFVGPVNDFVYYRACRDASWRGVRFVPETGKIRLAAYYQAASVHALVSWYETPGLATLEAAACGCKVVSTSRGCAEEYLNGMAWYCAPDDPAGIRRAIMAALAAAEPADLSAMVRSRYSWKAAAEATLAAYRSVLSF